MSIKNVVVFGATGMIGKPVTKELVQAGFKVKALCRDVQKAQSSLPDQVIVSKGDLTDSAKVAQITKGMDALYVNLAVDQTAKAGDWCAEREGLNTILDAAKVNGVKRVVYLSSIIKDDRRSNWWVYQVKREAVERVKNSGIAYTIFEPSCFMENLNTLQIQGENLMNISGSKTKNYWISGRDFGRMVAASLKSTFAENKTYVAQGPEALTTDEAAAQFLKAYKVRTLTLKSAPLPLMRLLGFFSGGKMRYMTRIMNSVMTFPEEFRGEVAWNELYRPQDTVASFAAQLKT